MSNGHREIYFQPLDLEEKGRWRWEGSRIGLGRSAALGSKEIGWSRLDSPKAFILWLITRQCPVGKREWVGTLVKGA